MKQLVEYKTISPAVTKAASEKFSNHMWYLSKESVALVFFDKSVTLATKRKMVNSLEKVPNKATMKRTKFDLRLTEKKELDDFVSKNTLQLLKKLQLPQQFLSNDPASWAD